MAQAPEVPKVARGEIAIKEEVTAQWQAMSKGDSEDNFMVASVACYANILSSPLSPTYPPKSTVQGKTPVLSLLANGTGGFQDLLSVFEKNPTKMMNGVLKVKLYG